jgi:hypothetical protein
MENELTQFARVFQDEEALRKSIATLFRHRSDVTGVEITHGSLERGKDIVFYAYDPVGERKLHACVIKHGKITGSADSDRGALNVLTQVTQALENPYLNPAGQNDDVSQVYVMTPHEISQMQTQIEKDDPVTILLTEHSVFGAPSQFRRTYVKQRFCCPLVEYQCALVVPSTKDFTNISLQKPAT